MEYWRKTKTIVLANCQGYQWMVGLGLTVLLLEVLIVVLRGDLPTLLAFNAFPSARATGHVIIGGETIEIDGVGYHDHDYANVPISEGFRGWFWARPSFERYTTLALEVQNGERFGGGRRRCSGSTTQRRRRSSCAPRPWMT